MIDFYVDSSIGERAPPVRTFITDNDPAVS
jgi:hypothetical protein